MHEKTKVVLIMGHKFQLTKLPARVGSFIFWRLLGACSQVAERAASRNGGSLPTAQDAPESTPEQRLRSMCAIGFSTMSFEDFDFIQRQALANVLRFENDIPMPIMMANGQWADSKDTPISTNTALVTKLTEESLVFSLADFFEESSAGDQPKAPEPISATTQPRSQHSIHSSGVR
jgi:hypothetical protein